MPTDSPTPQPRRASMSEINRSRVAHATPAVNGNPLESAELPPNTTIVIPVGREGLQALQQQGHLTGEQVTAIRNGSNRASASYQALNSSGAMSPALGPIQARYIVCLTTDANGRVSGTPDAYCCPEPTEVKGEEMVLRPTARINLTSPTNPVISTLRNPPELRISTVDFLPTDAASTTFINTARASNMQRAAQQVTDPNHQPSPNTQSSLSGHGLAAAVAAAINNTGQGR